MPLFTIDANKCNRDKLCVLECPMQIIKMKSDTDVPELAEGAEKACINCGHCVAVCPTGAFSLATMKSEECEPVSPDWNPGEKVIKNYMKARRSIRKYKKGEVEKEKLTSLMEMAAYAPSGHNSRPVNWTVINGREKVKEIASIVIDWMKQMRAENPEQAKMWSLDMITDAWDMGMDIVTRDAPALILVHGRKSDPNSSTACIVALSHLELAAPSLGLGCCWAGYITWCASMYKPLSDKLELPKGHALFGTVFTGYPLFKYHRIPKRESVVFWK